MTTTITAMALIGSHFLVFLLGIKAGRLIERIKIVTLIQMNSQDMEKVLRRLNRKKANR